MYKRIKLVRKLIHLQLTHAGHNKRYINYIYMRCRHDKYTLWSNKQQESGTPLIIVP